MARATEIAISNSPERTARNISWLAPLLERRAETRTHVSTTAYTLVLSAIPPWPQVFLQGAGRIRARTRDDRGQGTGHLSGPPSSSTPSPSAKPDPGAPATTPKRSRDIPVAEQPPGCDIPSQPPLELHSPETAQRPRNNPSLSAGTPNRPISPSKSTRKRSRKRSLASPPPINSSITIRSPHPLPTCQPPPPPPSSTQASPCGAACRHQHPRTGRPPNSLFGQETSRTEYGPRERR